MSVPTDPQLKSYVYAFDHNYFKLNLKIILQFEEKGGAEYR